MDSIRADLAKTGLRALEAGPTALDAYHGLRPAPLRFLLVEGSLVDLARSFEGLEYPGLPWADASLPPPPDSGEPRVYFRVAEATRGADRSTFPPFDLLRDPARRVFLDPSDIYPSLRTRLLEPRESPPELAIFEAAAILARHPHDLPADWIPVLPRAFPLAAQRDLLDLVLTGLTPDRALDFLRRIGFVEAFWPELAELGEVGHSKEYLPEGDGWRHTLETFRYRKHPDLILSLALLLHDTGKPGASADSGRRFSGHAELGRAVAERFLRRLGFPPSTVADVSFLVRNHMFPAALPRLPWVAARELVEDPRFPLLLEVYKCDELSTFRGPEAYYEACAAYRALVRNGRNPWRTVEGKKLARAWLGGAL